MERPPQSAPGNIPDESVYDEPSTEVVREMPGRLGQQTDAYASHPNGAGVSSAA